MSVFSDMMGRAMNRLQEVHPAQLTYSPVGGSSTFTVTALSVEAVGALDPFADITFSIAASEFGSNFEGLDPNQPSGNDEITYDGGLWTVVKTRNNSGVWEIRALKAEEVI